MSSLKEFLCLKYLSRRHLLLTSYISCLSKTVGLTLMCLYGGGLKSKRTVKFVFFCGILKFPETPKPQTIKIIKYAKKSDIQSYIFPSYTQIGCLACEL